MHPDLLHQMATLRVRDERLAAHQRHSRPRRARPPSVTRRWAARRLRWLADRLADEPVLATQRQ
jgi:hypothetical protein